MPRLVQEEEDGDRKGRLLVQVMATEHDDYWGGPPLVVVNHQQQ